MDRRDFLGSLIAVTTALATGVKLPAGKEIARAPHPARLLSDRVVAMLKECRVVSVASNMSLDRPLTYTVEYIHIPGSKKDADTAMIDSYTAGMRPVTVSFEERAGELTKLTVEWM